MHARKVGARASLQKPCKAVPPESSVRRRLVLKWTVLLASSVHNELEKHVLGLAAFVAIEAGRYGMSQARPTISWYDAAVLAASRLTRCSALRLKQS